jgi:hypothetical protein
MKKNLHKKFARYAAAAAGVVGATSASGQVVYTDVDPDLTSSGTNAVPLDMDNDASIDYVIQGLDTVVGSTYSISSIAPYGTAGNEIGGSVPSGYNYALALSAGDMIDASVNWIAASNTMSYKVDGAFPYNENWNAVTDKYLALRFNSGGNQYYGWARMDVDGSAMTLKDYAYESTSGNGITAGDMGSGASLEDLNVDDLVHFINQPNNAVQVRINGNLSNGQITITAASGQLISNTMVNSDVETIDMNGLASGLYLINVSFSEGSVNKKLFVK